MPTPARARGAAALAENAACERCHEREAAEWRGSLHQRADVEPSYRRAFAIEPLPFCRGCHAPEADPTREPPAELSALGVGCVTCHVTGEGEVLAGASRRSAEAPHAVQRDARFAGPAGCASCHEFAFPSAAGRGAASLMQSTVTEHASSPEAAVACASCHMRRDGRVSHRFSTTRDPSVLRGAVRVEARREGQAIVLALTPVSAGHAVPTGDLFRRLELSAEVVGPDQMVLGSANRYLTRHFALRPRMPGRQLVRDDRLFGGKTEVRLDLGEGAAGREIAFRVAYQRVSHPNGADDEAADVEAEVELASGRLAP